MPFFCFLGSCDRPDEPDPKDEAVCQSEDRVHRKVDERAGRSKCAFPSFPNGLKSGVPQQQKNLMFLQQWTPNTFDSLSIFEG